MTPVNQAQSLSRTKRVKEHPVLDEDPAEVQRIEESLGRQEKEAAGLSSVEKRVLEYARDRSGQIPYERASDYMSMAINDVKKAAHALGDKGLLNAGEHSYWFNKPSSRKSLSQAEPALGGVVNQGKPEIEPVAVYKGDLPVNEYNALNIINNSSVTTINSLMHDLCIKKPQAADILDGLETKGLVRQERMSYNLTPAGGTYLSSRVAQ
ncbi:MAG: hypothetical protein HY513_01915 [Candidatus Aenigmarchaeota archaeon]|nr:hypothetical protein [Candidatus Aenigmarchaeota archaeon]